MAAWIVKAVVALTRSERGVIFDPSHRCSMNSPVITCQSPHEVSNLASSREGAEKLAEGAPDLGAVRRMTATGDSFHDVRVAWS